MYYDEDRHVGPNSNPGPARRAIEDLIDGQTVSWDTIYDIIYVNSPNREDLIEAVNRTAEWMMNFTTQQRQNDQLCADQHVIWNYVRDDFYSMQDCPTSVLFMLLKNAWRDVNKALNNWVRAPGDHLQVPQRECIRNPDFGPARRSVEEEIAGVFQGDIIDHITGIFPGSTIEQDSVFDQEPTHDDLVDALKRTSDYIGETEIPPNNTGYLDATVDIWRLVRNNGPGSLQTCGTGVLTSLFISAMRDIWIVATELYALAPPVAPGPTGPPGPSTDA